MVFATDLTLRAPTDEEMINIAGDPMLLMAQAAIAMVKERK